MNSLERNKRNEGVSNLIIFNEFSFLLLLLLLLLFNFAPLYLIEAIFPRLILFPINFALGFINLTFNLLLLKLLIDCFNEMTLTSFNPTIILFLVFSSSFNSSSLNNDFISNLLFFFSSTCWLKVIPGFFFIILFSLFIILSLPTLVICSLFISLNFDILLSWYVLIFTLSVSLMPSSCKLLLRSFKGVYSSSESFSSEIISFILFLMFLFVLFALFKKWLIFVVNFFFWLLLLMKLLLLFFPVLNFFSEKIKFFTGGEDEFLFLYFLFIISFVLILKSL